MSSYSGYSPGNPNRGYQRVRGSGGGGYGGQQNPQPAINNPQFSEDFYVYSVNVASITTLATENVNFQIQADSDFEWVEGTCSANLNANAEPWTDAAVIPITIQIQDAGSGRLLLSNPVPITGLFGTGKQPFILPVTRRFNAKSTVNVTLVSFSASTWNNIFINFIGRKIFDLRAKS